MSERLILFGPLPPPYGGVSVFVSTLLAHLKDYDFQMWTLYGSGETDRRIVRIKHRRLEVVAALRKHAAGARIVDFTHFHIEHPNKILLPIWLTAKLRLKFEWVKYVLDGSLPRRHERFDAVQRRLFNSAVKAIDQFIVVSEELRDWLRDEIRVRQKISVIPCLLPILEQKLTEPLPVKIEAQLEGFQTRRYRLCSIGAFIPLYGFQQVAKAVERLRNETGEDVGLVLMDGAFADDAEYRENVLSGRDWISVLSKVPNAQVYQILRMSDLFVRGPADEGYGISRVEAMWCGVPVVATNVGETRGMHVYQFGDEEKLAELIREILFTADGEALAEETNHWTRQFRLEAEKNLQRFIETVGLS